MVVFGQSGLVIRIHDDPLSVSLRIHNSALTYRLPVLCGFGTRMSTKAKDSLQKIRFFLNPAVHDLILDNKIDS